MIEPDVKGWTYVGATANTKYYELEPRILAVVPNKGTEDNEKTAAENAKFQLAELGKRGGGAVVIFFDMLAYQDRGARQVYQQMDPAVLQATALVGGAAIQRTLAGFFLSLFKPKTPLMLFGDVDSALKWTREKLAAANAAGRAA